MALREETREQQLARWAKKGAWIGVDLDGTLAEYTVWKGPHHIGPPILVMLERVKRWLAAGVEVRIFTARAEDEGAALLIRQYCHYHLGMRTDSHQQEGLRNGGTLG
jgi:hypothetical protein